MTEAVNGNPGVVITGASTGIGLACAVHLHEMGFHVFAGVRGEGDAARLREQMPERCTPLFLDVTSQEQIEEAAALVRQDHGGNAPLSVVNNAGIAVSGPLETLPFDALREQFEVNVMGLLAVTRAFLPLIRETRGRVVHMGSAGGRMSSPFLGPYCATKFALEALTDSMRLELAPWNIEVVLVEPGAIDTPIWGKSKTRAEALQARSRGDEEGLYREALERFKAYAETIPARAVSAGLVSDAVVHALTAPVPRTRYLLGSDARGQALLGRLPDRWRDAILRRLLKL